MVTVVAGVGGCGQRGVRDRKWVGSTMWCGVGVVVGVGVGQRAQRTALHCFHAAHSSNCRLGQKRPRTAWAGAAAVTIFFFFFFCEEGVGIGDCAAVAHCSTSAVGNRSGISGAWSPTISASASVMETIHLL